MVMDASAILCLLNGEKGADQVAAALSGSIIGAANYAEVVGKLRDSGMTAEDADEALGVLDLDVRPFTRAQAARAGYLRPETKEAGLSLGDRACIALALDLNGTAVTCDREWKKPKIEGLKLRVVR